MSGCTALCSSAVGRLDTILDIPDSWLRTQTENGTQKSSMIVYSFMSLTARTSLLASMSKTRRTIARKKSALSVLFTISKNCATLSKKVAKLCSLRDANRARTHGFHSSRKLMQRHTVTTGPWMVAGQGKYIIWNMSHAFIPDQSV